MDRSSLSERRSSISRKRMNSLLDGILKEINEIEALEKAGKIENSKNYLQYTRGNRKSSLFLTVKLSLEGSIFPKR